MLTTLLVVWAALMGLAVVVLFAMLAELSTREQSNTPAPKGPPPLHPLPVPTFRPTTVPYLPSGRGLASTADGLLVLSDNCQTCRDLVADWEFVPRDALGRLEIVVVAASESSAQGLLHGTALEKRSLELDVAGRWTRATLGLESSPAFVVLAQGSCKSAYHVFTITHVTDLLHSQRVADHSEAS